jgi:hypothetical protein
MSISYIMILIIIILVILVIIIISSISYSGVEEDENVLKTKKFPLTMKLSEMKNIRPEIKHNCNTLKISQMSYNYGYSIIGHFNESCFSIYKNGERIYSRIVNGDYNIVFSSNYNILTPLIKLSKYKNIVIPLENNFDYVIAFDKAENIEIKNYIVNQNISFNEIPINYETSYGFNEYDIHFLTSKMIAFKSNIKDINTEIEKVHLSHFNKYDEWEFNREGNFVMSIIYNLYNLDIINKNTGEIIEIRKNEKQPDINFIELNDPNIIIKNLDFIGDKKDINTEYIELINGPLNLVERFLKGKKSKKINYSMLINNKVIVFKN